MLRGTLPFLIVLGLGLYFGVEFFETGGLAKVAALSLFQRNAQPPATSPDELVERVVEAMRADDPYGVTAMFPTADEAAEACFPGVGSIASVADVESALSRCRAMGDWSGVSRVRMKGGAERRRRGECARVTTLSDIRVRAQTGSGRVDIELSGAVVVRGRYFLTQGPVCRTP